MVACRGAAWAGALCISLPAAAQVFSGGVGVASEKLYRGLSQGAYHPSVMLDGVLRGDTGWALSGGVATLPDNGRGTHQEIDIGGAWYHEFADDWHAQLGATGYVYPGSRSARYRDYAEASAGIDWQGRLSATAFFAPRASGVRNGAAVRGRTWAVEFGWHQPLPLAGGRWSFDAGLGFTDTSRIGGNGYRYGSVGLSWGVGPVRLFASYVASDAASRGAAPSRIAGQRGLVAAWASF